MSVRANVYYIRAGPQLMISGPPVYVRWCKCVRPTAYYIRSSDRTRAPRVSSAQNFTLVFIMAS